MTINIGDKEPLHMTEKEFQAFLFNNGFSDWSLGSLPIPRVWNDPVIKITDRFENSIYFEYSSEHIKDSRKFTYKGYVDFNGYHIFYEKHHNQSEVRYFKISDINYLIENGFKVALASFKEKS